MSICRNMGVFRFKQFAVRNENSAMKVNTDGVLLGAVTEVLPTDRNVLDIGTGTGTVALMIAQRLAFLTPDFRIDAIDIDAPSAAEAAANFASSPWKDRLFAKETGLASFAESDGLPSSAPGGTEEDRGYDLIVSNPPYFDSSLKAPEERRNNARHVADPESDPGTEALSFREVLEYSEKALRPGGRVCLVLPADQEKTLLRYAAMYGFSPWKTLRVKTVERKEPSRLIVQFRRRKEVHGQSVGSLTLCDEKGKRTPEYASLVYAYLLDRQD
ncbi:MAG: tRNA1(Val) (adenine(37)-N6)-methyltransferase [Candidatus Cryptobacteroides sp.]